jgi:hypothetical protein
VSTKKTKTNPLYDDHDDAHFDGNPAYRKHHVRKRVAGKINTGAGASGRTGKYVGGKKKTTRKRVAGK